LHEVSAESSQLDHSRDSPGNENSDERCIDGGNEARCSQTMRSIRKSNGHEPSDIDVVVYPMRFDGLRGRSLMLYPLLPTLRAAGALVPSELVSRAALDRIARTVEDLPNAFSGYFFECPLAVGGSRTDILLATRARSGGPVALAHCASMESASGRLVEFFRRWADPADAFRTIPLVLLEFDLDGEGDTVPGFHFTVDPAFLEHRRAPRPNAPVLDDDSLRCLATEVLGIVGDEPADPRLLQRLERCRATLPPGGRLLHLSLMRSRPRCPIKLNVIIPTLAVSSWLDAIGWPGDLDTVRDIIDRYGFGRPIAKLDVALGPELGKRLGFELWFPGSPEIEPRWIALFERLVADDLCSPMEARALSTWPGHDDVNLDGLGWPLRLERSLELKLVCEGPSRSAKAYLGFATHFALVGASRSTPTPMIQLIRKVRRPRLSLATILAGPELNHPSALFGPDALRQLATTAERLPIACSSFCLECRMTSADAQVDLLGCIRVSDGGRDALAEASVTGWDPITSFVDRWNTTTSVLHEAVPFIWLEFDLPPASTRVPLPSLYVGVQARPEVPRERARFHAVLLEIVSLFGTHDFARARERAEHCVAALPNGAQLNCIGVMLPRRTDGLRLSLELPFLALRPYLTAIEWPGMPHRLGPIERFLDHEPDRLALTLDMTHAVEPRLGVELFFHDPPAVEPRFRALLDDLEAVGCDHDKRRALDNWRGRSKLADDHAYERTVYHVKLVLDVEAPLIVKSYPWITGMFTNHRS